MASAAIALLGTTGPRDQGGQRLRVLLGRGEVQPSGDSGFSFQGRPYRGTFSTTLTGEIVSVVSLEEYLYSVVPREMPRSWPQAALQAQAIAARTYVLQRSNPLREYDLVPSEADQVYAGIDAETPATTSAVDASAGRVLRFGRGFAQIAYSSCCGGHTEASSLAWNTVPISYLDGVACAYCSDSPWYRWTRRIAVEEFVAALGSQIVSAGVPASVALDRPDPSGRVPYWTVAGDKGTARVKAADVRRAIGSRTLPSLLVRQATFDGSELVVDGGGLGHGVGLCQWGARGLALAGGDARAILRLYFPGTSSGND